MPSSFSPLARRDHIHTLLKVLRMVAEQRWPREVEFLHHKPARKSRLWAEPWCDTRFVGGMGPVP